MSVLREIAIELDDESLDDHTIIYLGRLQERQIRELRNNADMPDTLFGFNVRVSDKESEIRIVYED